MSVKKNSYEKQWQDALQNAEEKAPVGLWENIEGKLNQEATPTEAFKATILAASEKPDASVWSNIEAELDKEKERKPFIFVWFNRYAATGIAAMLLMALGISLFNTSDPEFEKNVELASEKVETAGSQTNGTSERPTAMDAEMGNNVYNDVTPTASSDLTSNSSAGVSSLPSIPEFEKESSSIVTTSILTALENSNSEKPTPVVLKSELFDEKPASILASLELLIGKGFDFYGNSIILERKKLTYEKPEGYFADNSNFLQRSWFGLVSGLSPFNPNFDINNFERETLVSVNNLPQSALEFYSKGETTDTSPHREKFAFPLLHPYNNVKTGRAINLGFDYGKRFRKRLSIESGIRYLAGNTLVLSNVYSYNEYTGNISTFFESNYIKNDRKTVFDNTVITSGGEVTSDYKYIIVPLQLGYHLPITKKIETSLNLGVSGDFIISNVFDDISKGGSRLTSANSAYKTINLSGIGSLNINYAVRENWEISLGTRMQQTLTSGVEKNLGFSFKPRYIGINTGINYRFH